MIRDYVEKETYIDGSYARGRRLPLKLKNQYTVKIHDNCITAFDKTLPILVVALSPISWKGLHLYNVETADVRTDYQGNGLCKELYIALLQNNIAICSNGSHSLGARKTWARVAAERNVNAYGFDPNHEIFWKASPNKRRSEVISAKNYPSIYTGEDNGIILVRNGSDQDRLIKSYLRDKPKKFTKKDFLKNNSFSPKFF